MKNITIIVFKFLSVFLSLLVVLSSLWLDLLFLPFSMINWNLFLIASFSCTHSARVSLFALLVFHQFITEAAQSVCHPHVVFFATDCFTFRKISESPLIFPFFENQTSNSSICLSLWSCLFSCITLRNSSLNSDRNLRSHKITHAFHKNWIVFAWIGYKGL